MTSAKRSNIQSKPNQTKPNQHIMADDFRISELASQNYWFDISRGQYSKSQSVKIVNIRNIILPVNVLFSL